MRQLGAHTRRLRELIAWGKACGDLAAARKKVSTRHEQDIQRREVVAELLKLVDIAVSREP